jgi:hypothetical protein
LKRRFPKGKRETNMERKKDPVVLDWIIGIMIPDAKKNSLLLTAHKGQEIMTLER